MALTDTQKDILLREYAEAGEICRHHEDLTRKSLHFFIIVTVAIMGATQYDYLSKPPINSVIEMAGCLFGIFFINTILRLRRYYSSYIARARAIEAALKEGEFEGMQLYTKGREDFNNSREKLVTFSNKLAIVALILVTTIYFWVMSVVHAYEWKKCLFILFPVVAVLVTWLLEKIFEHKAHN